MQVFGTLKLLVVLLGSSWLLWGRSGPKKAPKIGPQMVLNGQQEAQAQLAGALLKTLVSNMAPRWLKMAPSSPDSRLGAFLGVQSLSWKALDTQKPSKNAGLTFA